MSNTPSVYRAQGPMATRRASVAKVNRLPAPPPREPGRARETAPANDTLPYHVELFGKVRRYQNGRDALAFARAHHGASVYFTAPRYEKLDYATQVLPRTDRAKPPKGTCGAFCNGETTKFVTHHVAREDVVTRIY